MAQLCAKTWFTLLELIWNSTSQSSTLTLQCLFTKTIKLRGTINPIPLNC